MLAHFDRWCADRDANGQLVFALFFAIDSNKSPIALFP
jgi:hypothetical protein